MAMDIRRTRLLVFVPLLLLLIVCGSCHGAPYLRQHQHQHQRHDASSDSLVNAPRLLETPTTQQQQQLQPSSSSSTLHLSKQHHPQQLQLQPQTFASELRQLEEEQENHHKKDDTSTTTTTTRHSSWFFGIEKNSWKYDVLQGFFWISVCMMGVGSILYVLYWYCCVPCGCMEDYRTDKQRWMRRMDDGRGVFSPLTGDDNYDEEMESVWDDAASEDSMEYGHSHLEDEYGEIDEQHQEDILFSAAQTYFEDADDPRNNNAGGGGGGKNSTANQNSTSPNGHHQHPEDEEEDTYENYNEEDDDDLQVETIDDILEVEMVERS